MACRTCGSDWTTIAGKDCNRCPACDRLQRCIARKQGRLPAQMRKSCGICGASFDVEPTRQHVKTCESPICRAEWIRRRRAQYKKQRGLKPKVVRAKMKAKKTCCRDGCNRKVKDNRHDYCSRTCAGLVAKELKRRFLGMSVDARKAKAFAGWMHDWESQRPQQKKFRSDRKPRPFCDTCGSEVHAGTRFCSYECVKAWRGVRTCETCGVSVEDCTAYSKVRCDGCRIKAKRISNRKAKQKYGRNHRQRARRAGVLFVSFPVRAIYERDGWRCQICRRKCNKKFLVCKKTLKPHPRSPTLDHIKSFKDGGNHEPGNVQLACLECNTRKGARSRGQLRMAFA